MHDADTHTVLHILLPVFPLGKLGKIAIVRLPEPAHRLDIGKEFLEGRELQQEAVEIFCERILRLHHWEMKRAQLVAVVLAELEKSLALRDVILRQSDKFGDDPDCFIQLSHAASFGGAHIIG